MPLAINYAKVINDLADAIYETADSQGFWDFEHIGIQEDTGAIPLKLALIISEATEALAVHRKMYEDLPEDKTTAMTDIQEDDFADELADIIIRVLDLSGAFGFDIGQAIMDKMAVNRTRPFRHNKRY